MAPANGESPVQRAPLRQRPGKTSDENVEEVRGRRQARPHNGREQRVNNK